MTEASALSSMTNKKPIIALDCDGVLLDYNAMFAQIYQQAFGKQLTVVSPKSFRATNMYDVKFTPEERIQFNAVWDAAGWRSMPTLNGALQACHLLHQAGYELVCVTTMPARFTEHRLENLRSHGFPIDRVIASGNDGENPITSLKKQTIEENPNTSPKKQTIEELHPVAFVDDLKHNFKDIQGVHTKLVFIDNEYHDVPSQNENIFYDVKYSSLLAFVHDFLKTEHGQEIVWAERPAFLLPST